MYFLTLCIVGRTNVGKSTLFNRLTKSKRATVDDQPGVTVDRNMAWVDTQESSFFLVDTGGFGNKSDDLVQNMTNKQVLLGIEQADAILFMLDCLDGVTAADQDILYLLRKKNVKFYTLVNKVDSEHQEMYVAEFFSIEKNSIYPMSALNGRGLNNLLTDIQNDFKIQKTTQLDYNVSLAIVGRPNVGKSSIINKLLKEDRLVTMDEPGTTRDSIDVFYSYGEHTIKITDTAGIRKKARISLKLESDYVFRALNSIHRSDVAALILEPNEGITAQDIKIARLALMRNKALVLVFNKWDLYEKDGYSISELKQEIAKEFNFLDFCPILFISARTGSNIENILKIALEINQQKNRRIQTADLNKILKYIRVRQPNLTAKKKTFKIYYVTQINFDIPAFVFFVNYPELLTSEFERYIENQFRYYFKFQGAPIKFFWKKRVQTPIFSQKA